METSDAKKIAQEVGMTFFISEDGGTARLYYDKLDLPEELYWVEAVLQIFIRQNPDITVTSVTEIHKRLIGETLFSKIKNLFQKSNPIGVLIVYKIG